MKMYDLSRKSVGNFMVEGGLFECLDHRISFQMIDFRRDNFTFVCSKIFSRPFANKSENGNYCNGEKIDQHYINKMYFLRNIINVYENMEDYWKYLKKESSSKPKATEVAKKEMFLKKQLWISEKILPELYEYHYMIENWNVCDKISILIDNCNEMKFFAEGKYVGVEELPFSPEMCEILERKHEEMMKEILSWKQKNITNAKIIERNESLAKNLFNQETPSDIHIKYFNEEFER